MRSEIQENLSFTPKETDIYKIHQSGDLANLDGLEDSALKLLPSLLTLRNALYSSAFREYLSNITGSGALSGRKTDMAINVYTPGCHLLCHDDVIGSRRVSYILYLTDPDDPWKKEWGGALRLYPTEPHTGPGGKSGKIPLAYPTVSIPPAFNQLSFFAVQPAESFHDVEEVLPSEGNEARIRMAISGWYHIPQEGEEGFVEGLEEELTEKSSLAQLQGKSDEFDLPKTKEGTFNASFSSSFDVNDARKSSYMNSQEDLTLTEEDLALLLKYIAPTYLTPDTLDSISRHFSEQCSLVLETFLSSTFSTSLRDYIVIQESLALPAATAEIESTTPWMVASPPHKHRFLFQQIREAHKRDPKSQSPLQDLLENLLPSRSFCKWLQLATGETISSQNLLARRFRRGKDYTLATGYDEEDSRLEITLATTPTTGWEPEEAAASDPVGGDVGGYVAYMAGDEDDMEGKEDNEENSSIDKGSNNEDVKEDEQDDKKEGDEKKHDDKKLSEKEHEEKTNEKVTDQEKTGEGKTDKEEMSKEKINEEKRDKRTDIENKQNEEKKDDNGSNWNDGQSHSNDDKKEDVDVNKKENNEREVTNRKEIDTGETIGVDKNITNTSKPIPLPPPSAKPEPAPPSLKSPKRPKPDPAIYQSKENEDDSILFSMPATWNQLGIVLRDRGVLRFVKYVSQQAKGDRWDICGEFSVVNAEEEEEAIQAGEGPTGDEVENIYETEEEVDVESEESSDDF